MCVFPIWIFIGRREFVEYQTQYNLSLRPVAYLTHPWKIGERFLWLKKENVFPCSFILRIIRREQRLRRIILYFSILNVGLVYNEFSKSDQKMFLEDNRKILNGWVFTFGTLYSSLFHNFPKGSKSSLAPQYSGLICTKTMQVVVVSQLVEWPLRTNAGQQKRLGLEGSFISSKWANYSREGKICCSTMKGGRVCVLFFPQLVSKTLVFRCTNQDIVKGNI